MHDDDKNVQLIPGLENRRPVMIFIYFGLIHVDFEISRDEVTKKPMFLLQLFNFAPPSTTQEVFHCLIDSPKWKKMRLVAKFTE
jgi:hypothetical protein